MKNFNALYVWLLLLFIEIGCSSDTSDDVVLKEVIEEPNPEPTPVPDPVPSMVYTVDNISDTYFEVAGEENASQWGPYNVHDPSIIKVDNIY